jgi:hypothetical protein
VSTLIVGTAYRRRATLDIVGETLTWRAQRGTPAVAENIVTTVHDVRFASLLAVRYSRAALTIIALGVIWAIRQDNGLGLVVAGAGAALGVWTFLRPRQFLVLEVGQNRLVMQVHRASAGAAQLLAARIDRALESGEGPARPPALP